MKPINKVHMTLKMIPKIQFAFLTMAGLLLLTDPVSANPSRYLDVSTEDKAYAAIEYLSQKNIFRGYPDGRFRPEVTINRAQLLAVVVRQQGIEPNASEYQNCFVDVKTEWFAPYVCYAKQRSWVQGYESGEFRPNQGVTHAEALKMVLRPLFFKEIFGQTEEEIKKAINNAGYTYLGEEIFSQPEEEIKVAMELANDPDYIYFKDSDNWYLPYLSFASTKNFISKNYISNLDEAMSRGDIADFMFKVLLTRENNWERYDDYTRDRYFLENENEALLSQNYPCYTLAQDTPVFLTDYLKNEYGINYIDTKGYLDESSTDKFPYFQFDRFCLLENHDYLMLGSSIGENDEVKQHAVRFNQEGELVNDDTQLCENKIFSLLRELPRVPKTFDPNTLELMDCIYLKDAENVYGMGDLQENADPDTFVPLSFPYAKDANQVYLESYPIEGADPKTFVPFEIFFGGIELALYAKDSNHVYLFGEVMTEADPATFEAIPLPPLPEQWLESDVLTDRFFDFFERIYAKDKNHWYAGDEKIEGVDYDTFEILDFFHAKDVNHVYLVDEIPYINSEYSEAIVEGADPASFVSIGFSPYGKDLSHVYFNGEVMDGADPATAELVKGTSRYNEFWLKDKSRLYVDGEVASGIGDLESFEVIDRYYGKDMANVYHLREKYNEETGEHYFPIVEGADPATFEMLEGWDPYSYLYRDAHHLYLEGMLLETGMLDLESLEWVDGYTLKDAKNFTCKIAYSLSMAECEQK